MSQYPTSDKEIRQDIEGKFICDLRDSLFIAESQVADTFYANTDDESHIYFRKRAKLKIEFYKSILNKVSSKTQTKSK